MKVLFALDAVSCGSASELRSKRKELTTRANKLLDALQAAQKPAAAATEAAAAATPTGSTGPAAAAAVGQQQQQQQPSIAEQYRKKSWFRR
jgi:hypothetical protein